jgi:hypothetical protein
VTSASSRDAQVPGPSQDLFLIYAARAVRGLGDDFAVIVLPAYLPEIGFSPLHAETTPGLSSRCKLTFRGFIAAEDPSQLGLG